jgi:hypothetical protein
MKHTSRLSIALAMIWILSGCATSEPDAKGDAPANVKLAELSQGYALLYDLVSNEKRVNLLSVIKKESPDLKSLLERVSEASKATAKEMETLAKLDPPLNLKVTHLPRIEEAARDSIEKETSRAILNSEGVRLEFTIVSSQLSGMNYAAHLARILAAVDPNPQRKQFLQRTDRTFSDLHRQMYNMLYARYQR